MKKVGNHSYIEHNYSFKGKTGKRYIVVVEEYNYIVYIAKFYPQENKRQNNRYNCLTSLNECSRIITTVAMILKDLYKKNPFASFGFIGSNLLNEKKELTKRFQLYSKVCSQLISPIEFEHYKSERYSAYLLLNRNNTETNLLNKINEMFYSIYEFDSILLIN